MKLIHGGDVYSHKGDLLELDYSVNINPLGTPKTVLDAGVNALKTVERYPDPRCRELACAVAKKMRVSEESLIFGNGAAEIIFNIVFALKPKRVLLIAPSFAEYERGAEAVGAEVVYYYLSEENGFVLDEGILSCIDDSIDMVFVCNPNNPTGVCTDLSLTERILRKCTDCNIFLVVDECFMDFVENSKSYSLLDYINKYDKLMVLKAFTKLYAIPGVRLGYGVCGNSSLIEKMNKVRQPWSVSTIAQAMGIAAIGEKGLVDDTLKCVKSERKFLECELERLGIAYIKSSANYILLKTEIKLYDELLKRHILIRACSNYNGLSEEYYRIAVKAHSENLRLISAIEEVVKDYG